MRWANFVPAEHAYVCFGRELAYQIADQFRVFGSHIGLKSEVIVGGMGEREGGGDDT